MSGRDPGRAAAGVPATEVASAVSAAVASMPAAGPRWLTREQGNPRARPPLTRRRIVDAGLAVVEEHGLEGLTMRRLATGLDVSTMALYNHVADKAELVDLMLDFVLAEVVACFDGLQGDWVARMRSIARAFNAVWLDHPGLARVYGDGVTMGPNGLAIVEQLVGLLRQAGFGPEDAAQAFFAFYTFSVGPRQLAPARPVTAPGDPPVPGPHLPTMVRRFFSALPPDEIPNVLEVAPHMPGLGDQVAFEYGLDILLIGLETKLALLRQSQRTSGERGARTA